MAWFCKDDSAQNNSCDTAQIVARRSYSRKGSCVLRAAWICGKNHFAHQQTVDPLQKTNKQFIGIRNWIFSLFVFHGCEIGNLFESVWFCCVRYFDSLMHQTKNRRTEKKWSYESSVFLPWKSLNWLLQMQRPALSRFLCHLVASGLANADNSFIFI